MSNYMQAVKYGVLGAAMATGPGHARRDGVLGALQTGPGHAWRDGSLGATGAGEVYGLWATLQRDGVLVDEAQSFFAFSPTSQSSRPQKMVVRVDGVPADLKRGNSVRQQFFSKMRQEFAAKTPYVLDGISFMFDVATARTGSTKASTFYMLTKASSLPNAKWPSGLGTNPTWGTMGSVRNPAIRDWPKFTALPWNALGGLGAAPLTVSAEMIGFAAVGFAAVVLWNKHQKGEI
jgi:hypothetical protein